MIWTEEFITRLADLGEVRSYPAGIWLPADSNGQPVIRMIQSGDVDTFARMPTGLVHIRRYGPDEILGARANLYPDMFPRIGWKTASELTCLEIPWAELVTRMSTNPHLESILQHIARIRLYHAVIATHPAFSCLGIPERDRLFEHAMVRLLAPGEQLIHKSGERAHLYLIVSGTIAVKNAGEILARRSNGELLGEMSLFGYSAEPTADAIAESLTELIEFRDSDMLSAMQDNPTFRQRVTALIASRQHKHDSTA